MRTILQDLVIVLVRHLPHLHQQHQQHQHPTPIPATGEAGTSGPAQQFGPLPTASCTGGEYTYGRGYSGYCSDLDEARCGRVGEPCYWTEPLPLPAIVDQPTTRPTRPAFQLPQLDDPAMKKEIQRLKERKDMLLKLVLDRSVEVTDVDQETTTYSRDTLNNIALDPNQMDEMDVTIIHDISRSHGINFLTLANSSAVGQTPDELEKLEKMTGLTVWPVQSSGNGPSFVKSTELLGFTLGEMFRPLSLMNGIAEPVTDGSDPDAGAGSNPTFMQRDTYCQDNTLELNLDGTPAQKYDPLLKVRMKRRSVTNPRPSPPPPEDDWSSGRDLCDSRIEVPEDRGTGENTQSVLRSVMRGRMAHGQDRSRIETYTEELCNDLYVSGTRHNKNVLVVQQAETSAIDDAYNAITTTHLPVMMGIEVPAETDGQLEGIFPGQYVVFLASGLSIGNRQTLYNSKVGSDDSNNYKTEDFAVDNTYNSYLSNLHQASYLTVKSAVMQTDMYYPEEINPFRNIDPSKREGAIRLQNYDENPGQANESCGYNVTTKDHLIFALVKLEHLVYVDFATLSSSVRSNDGGRTYTYQEGGTEKTLERLDENGTIILPPPFKLSSESNRQRQKVYYTIAPPIQPMPQEGERCQTTIDDFNAACDTEFLVTLTGTHDAISLGQNDAYNCCDDMQLYPQYNNSTHMEAQITDCSPDNTDVYTNMANYYVGCELAEQARAPAPAPVTRPPATRPPASDPLQVCGQYNCDAHGLENKPGTSFTLQGSNPQETCCDQLLCSTYDCPAGFYSRSDISGDASYNTGEGDTTCCESCTNTSPQDEQDVSDGIREWWTSVGGCRIYEDGSRQCDQFPTDATWGSNWPTINGNNYCCTCGSGTR
jgi:hypothetical protein